MSTDNAQPLTSAMVAASPVDMATPNETAASAQAANEQALVLAMFTMSDRKPRNMGDVRIAMLKECERPRFAEVARYSIPFAGGKPATGFSIRFAEAAARCLRNLIVESPTIYEDADRRIVKVRVVDIESTLAYTKDVVIEKVVERRSPGKRTPLGARENAYGDQVFLVRATEQEFRAKAGAEISKAIRDCILRIVPGDILEECESKIARVLANDDKENPGEAVRRICDGFIRFGVKPSDLEALIGHTLDGVIPAELHMLRTYYAAIRDGEATWPQIVEAQRGPVEEGAEDPHSDLRARAQEMLRKSKSKSRKKRAAKKSPSGSSRAKANPSQPSSDDGPTSSEPSAPAGAGAALTPDQIAEGWELDPATGEAIPPVGGEG